MQPSSSSSAKPPEYSPLSSEISSDLPELSSDNDLENATLEITMPLVGKGDGQTQGKCSISFNYL